MCKNEIYSAIKNMTLGELLSIFNCNEEEKIIKEKEQKVNENIQVFNQEDTKVLYTVNDLIEKYPFFTRYNINKAIQNEGLPYCTIGNKRMFNKEEIDKWIEKETKPKKEKVKYEI